MLEQGHLERPVDAWGPSAAQDLSQVGARVWNLERLYNQREGFTAADDTLPERLLNEPVAEGPSAGFTVKLAPMLQEYYEFRGWDEQGVPLPETLVMLGLDELVNEELGLAA